MPKITDPRPRKNLVVTIYQDQEESLKDIRENTRNLNTGRATTSVQQEIRSALDVYIEDYKKKKHGK